MEHNSEGLKVYGIFAFCTIHNFNHLTDFLEEDIMIFINSIAEIVHFFVDRYSGSTNKNIGETFLIVWKMKNQQSIKDYAENDGPISLLTQ